ncbi:hypothetical protein NX059_007201 [Plenodomus lindquistii]|nr:hypothetical protein NX059_007201 [Plenodomus lindquistii]
MGYLMSDTDLGINGGPKFHLRQLRQCAPLATEGFKSTTTREEREVIQYYYQGPENATEPQPALEADTFFTWQVPLYNITKEGRLDSSKR